MQDSEIRKPSFLLVNSRWFISLSIASVILIAVSVLYLARLHFETEQSVPVPQTNQPYTQKINALGRLEPNGKVIQISAPTSFGSSSRVAELQVNEGDLVQVGQVLAILDSRDRLQANLMEAKQRVQVAQAQLEQVRAGARKGELVARRAAITNLQAELSGETQTQQATITRLEAEFQNAEREFRRNQTLYNEGAISASVLDSRRLASNTAQEQLNAARANLNRIKHTLAAQIQEAEATLEQTAEVRPTDVATAQAEVDSTLATVNRIQAELNQTVIRAPKAGQILRIRTQPGETPNSEGIVELGQTNQMVAIAEIYESDIAKIRQGQTAAITSLSNVFSGELRGTVSQIGLQVAKRDILDTDPTAATDARVIEVKIRLVGL